MTHGVVLFASSATVTAVLKIKIRSTTFHCRKTEESTYADFTTITPAEMTTCWEIEEAGGALGREQVAVNCAYLLEGDLRFLVLLGGQLCAET